MAAHQRQLAFEALQVGQAIAGVAGQAGSERIGAHLAGVGGGQEQLAGGGQVQRRPPANGAHHLHAGTLAPGAVDIDDLVALLHRQVDGLPGQLVQRPHGGDGRLAYVQPPLDQRAQFKQTHAQLIQAVVHPLDVAPHHQVVQDAVRGGGVQAGGRGQFLERDGIGLRGQRVEQAHGALDDLDGDGTARGAVGFGIQGVASGGRAGHRRGKGSRRATGRANLRQRSKQFFPVL